MADDINKIIGAAESLQAQAWKVIEDTRVIEIWEGIGAKINLVGSLKMGLLACNLDIDFHIYTDPFIQSDSFRAISQLAENSRIRTISYANLLDVEDKCLEWHAGYRDEAGDIWQIDMIHILADSIYAGHFERVAERVKAVMTPEMRKAILAIKYAIPEGEKVMGIRIYRAVIEGGVRDLDGFHAWEKVHPLQGIEKWIP